MGTYFIGQSNLVKPLNAIDVKVGHTLLVSAMGEQVILVKRRSSYAISVTLHLYSPVNSRSQNESKSNNFCICHKIDLIFSWKIGGTNWT